MRRTKPRLLILGLDGCTPQLLWPWARQGFLPHVARLMSEGAWGDLASTVPPLSPPAWVTIQTGVLPGKHGVFDFYSYSAQEGRFAFVSTSSVRSKTVWELLGAGGYSVGLINLFATYPAPRLRGLVLSGSPGQDNELAFHPTSLRDRLPGYFIELNLGKVAALDDAKFGELMLEQLAMRRKALEHFLAEGLELIFCVFTVSDRAQHFLWHTLGGSPGDIPQRDPSNAIFRLYRGLDAVVGRCLEALGEDDYLVVVSDHGFGPMEREFNVVRWLQDRGYLAASSRQADKYLSLQSWAKDFLAGLLPPAVKQRLKQGLRLNTFNPVPYLTCLDWAQTTAFAAGHQGGLRVNLKGRDPHGTVEPGRDYEQVRDRLIADLLAEPNPFTGRPLLRSVYRREEIYGGSYTELAPDLIPVWEDYAYSPNKEGAFSLPLFYEPRVKTLPLTFSGHHRPEGIFLARGPAFAPGRAVEGLRVQDVAPTALHLCGLPVSRHFDGRVVEEAMNGSWLASHPVTLSDEELYREGGRGGWDYSAQDSKDIEEKLRGLGYID